MLRPEISLNKRLKRGGKFGFFKPFRGKLFKYPKFYGFYPASYPDLYLYIKTKRLCLFQSTRCAMCFERGGIFPHSYILCLIEITKKLLVFSITHVSHPEMLFAFLRMQNPRKKISLLKFSYSAHETSTYATSLESITPSRLRSYLTYSA